MNQSTKSFSKQRNSHKAIENLWGLCFGLTADDDINPLEIQFFNLWLKENEHLHEDPDAYDLYECAKDIVKQGRFTKDHAEDLHELINQVMEYRSKRATNDQTRQTNVLLGFVQGLLADQILNDKEIRQLNEWMCKNEQWRTTWPGNAIDQRLQEILEDNLITDDERDNLAALLNNINNCNILETGSAGALTITLGVEDIDTLDFNKSTFCFTGTFLFGPRSACVSATETLGGINQKRITKTTNYLVLGTSVSRDWINTSFGRKIEKAKANQSKGANTIIITEETWVKHLIV